MDYFLYYICLENCFISKLQTQAGETGPFIDEILGGLNSIICDLSPQQVHVFYEAVGCLISAQTDPAIRESLIERLMQLPNSIWEEIISHASQVESFCFRFCFHF